MLNQDKNRDRKTFAKKLEERTKRFAVEIIKLSAKLPGTPEGRAVRYQLTKAGTSIGANYREANRSRSRADFKHKIKISETEASETQYWLEVIMDMEWLKPGEVDWEYKESGELLALFTSISNNLNSK